jgi:hypothetical protein
MRRRRLSILLAILAAVVLGAAATALAGFTGLVSASQSISTNALLAPTAVTATLTSQCKSNKAQQVTVGWTASASAFGTGYTIQRDGVTVATVSSTTTSYVDNGVGHSTSYTYTVLATYRSWSSGQAAPPITTC